MRFNVKFFYDGTGTAVRCPRRSLGLTFLDECRELGGPDVKLSDVEETVPEMARDVELTLTEAHARMCGRFLDRTDIRVNVPERSLNVFARLAPEFIDGGWRGVWKLDEAAILRAWADAGYPEKWNPPQDPLLVANALARGREPLDADGPPPSPPGRDLAVTCVGNPEL